MDLTCEVDNCSDLIKWNNGRYCSRHERMIQIHGIPEPFVVCYDCGASFKYSKVYLSKHYCPSCMDLIETYKHLLPIRAFGNHRISRVTYIKTLMAQGFKCAICKQESTKFCIDHDHKCCPGKHSCGKCFRGLLCRTCNIRVGYIESPLFSDTMKYLTPQEILA